MKLNLNFLFLRKRCFFYSVGVWKEEEEGSAALLALSVMSARITARAPAQIPRQFFSWEHFLCVFQRSENMGSNYWQVVYLEQWVGAPEAEPRSSPHGRQPDQPEVPQPSLDIRVHQSKQNKNSDNITGNAQYSPLTFSVSIILHLFCHKLYFSYG